MMERFSWHNFFDYVLGFFIPLSTAMRELWAKFAHQTHVLVHSKDNSWFNAVSGTCDIDGFCQDKDVPIQSLLYTHSVQKGIFWICESSIHPSMWYHMLLMNGAHSNQFWWDHLRLVKFWCHEFWVMLGTSRVILWTSLRIMTHYICMTMFNRTEVTIKQKHTKG